MKLIVAVVVAFIAVARSQTPPPEPTGPPPGLVCGPAENSGTCIPGCPCRDAPFHCDVYDDQCDVLNNDECCCYEPTDEDLPTLCTGEDPPGTACGTNENQGTCEVGCPCQGTPLHCDFFDDQCTVLNDPDACCCYDENEAPPPDVCFE